MTPPTDQPLTPVLQILHISDLHLRHKDFKPPKELQEMLGFLGNLPKYADKLGDSVQKIWPKLKPSLVKMAFDWESGLYGHDDDAIEELFEWLRDRVMPDPEWSEHLTWLVDTGDQSTFGDDLSLKLGLETLGRFSVALGNSPSTRIHGNHDAWAGKPPFITLPHTLNEQRQWMRSKHFIADYPADPMLTHTCLSNTLSIDVYQLNSVVHDFANNSLARGEVREDRFWMVQPSRKPKRGMQLKRFREIAARRHLSQSAPTLRIALMHHPLEHGGKNSYTKALKGAKKLHSDLSVPTEELDQDPLAHLVLSGHTHRLHPLMKEFQGSLIDDNTPRAKQLVVGTAAQRSMKTHQDLDLPEPNPENLTLEQRYPQQAQLLRIWQASSTGTCEDTWIAIDRIVVGRANAIVGWAVIRESSEDNLYERQWIKLKRR